MCHRFNGISTYRLMAKGREVNTLPMLLQQGLAQFTFYLTSCLLDTRTSSAQFTELTIYFLTFSVVIFVFYYFMHFILLLFINWLYLLSVIVYCLHIVKRVRLTYINKRLLTYLLIRNLSYAYLSLKRLLTPPDRWYTICLHTESQP